MLNFIAIAFYLLTRVSVNFGQKHARSRNVYVLILKKKNRWPHIPLNNKCCVELVTFVIKMVNLHETQRTPHHLQPLLQTFFVMNCSTVSWVFEMAEVETHWYRQTVMTFNVLFLCSNFKKIFNSQIFWVSQQVFYRTKESNHWKCLTFSGGTSGGAGGWFNNTYIHINSKTRLKENPLDIRHFSLYFLWMSIFRWKTKGAVNISQRMSNIYQTCYAMSTY